MQEYQELLANNTLEQNRRLDKNVDEDCHRLLQYILFLLRTFPPADIGVV